MNVKIIRQLIYTSLILVFICHKVRNFSGCPQIKIKKGFYDQNDGKYKCNSLNSYLFGNETLTCREDKSWEGEIPFCVSPIPVQILKNGIAVTAEMYKRYCISLDNHELWEIKVFNKTFSVIKLVTKDYRQNKRECISPIEILTKNNETCSESVHDCKNNLTESIYIFNNSMKGDIKFIQRHPQYVFSSVQVCGIYIYSKSNEECNVSLINVPNGYFSPKNAKILTYGKHITFYCDEGFHLQGIKYFYCGVVKRNIPRCIQKKFPVHLVVTIVFVTAFIIIILMAGYYYIFIKRFKINATKDH
ncbi:uncharacterized protein [Centruroides vittatus]|uniref:uncharacterized protein n=1 Tax=Centruroides vittatus TaxID=120091 RepID=UPI00350FBAF1